MVYQCAKCERTFEKDGLELILHEQCVFRICPECLANANTVSVTASRKAPGRPFEFCSLQADEDPFPVYGVNNET